MWCKVNTVPEKTHAMVISRTPAWKESREVRLKAVPLPFHVKILEVDKNYPPDHYESLRWAEKQTSWINEESFCYKKVQIWTYLEYVAFLWMFNACTRTRRLLKIDGEISAAGSDK